MTTQQDHYEAALSRKLDIELNLAKAKSAVGTMKSNAFYGNYAPVKEFRRAERRMVDLQIEHQEVQAELHRLKQRIREENKAALESRDAFFRRAALKLLTKSQLEAIELLAEELEDAAID